MNKKHLLIFTLIFLAESVSAKMVQSTTGVHLSFRQCVEGVTACDSMTQARYKRNDGLPGNSQAQASQEHPDYGAATGSTKRTGGPGNAEMKASVSTLKGARNGSNGFIIERYTNTAEHAQTLTLSATLTYDLTVPAENANFPVKGGVKSTASAELEIFTLDVSAIDAGTTIEENMAIFLGGSEPDAKYASLKIVRSNVPANISGAGAETISGTVVIEPGNSVWMISILQSLGSNGAVVNATLNTAAEIKERSE